jgi:hypothetical protein
MPGSEDYRHYAAECLELAATIDDPHIKAVLTHMAQAWLRLAEQKQDSPDAAKAPAH